MRYLGHGENRKPPRRVSSAMLWGSPARASEAREHQISQGRQRFANHIRITLLYISHFVGDGKDNVRVVSWISCDLTSFFASERPCGWPCLTHLKAGVISAPRFDRLAARQPLVATLLPELQRSFLGRWPQKSQLHPVPKSVASQVWASWTNGARLFHWFREIRKRFQFQCFIV